MWSTETKAMVHFWDLPHKLNLFEMIHGCCLATWPIFPQGSNASTINGIQFWSKMHFSPWTFFFAPHRARAFFSLGSEIVHTSEDGGIYNIYIYTVYCTFIWLAWMLQRQWTTMLTACFSRAGKNNVSLAWHNTSTVNILEGLCWEFLFSPMISFFSQTINCYRTLHPDTEGLVALQKANNTSHIHQFHNKFLSSGWWLKMILQNLVWGPTTVEKTLTF